MVQSAVARVACTAWLLACLPATAGAAEPRQGAEPARDPVAAEALFQQARELLKQGAWGEACSKFETSMELDPSVSVLLKIARCREHEGKLAQAWYQLQRARALNLEQHRGRPAR